MQFGVLDVLYDDGSGNAAKFVHFDADIVAGNVRLFGGFGWDWSGALANVANWDDYLAEAALRLRMPVEVTMTAK